MSQQSDNSLLRAGVVCFLLFLLTVVLFSCAGCSRRVEPLTIYHESSNAAVLIAANLEAKDKGGKVYEVAATGSMEPVLHGGDIVVGVPTLFKDLAVGMIVNYRPSWNEGRLTIHRLVGAWPNGSFLAEGDGKDNRAEVKSSVDISNYVDHVVSVYRFP